jgi:hypothetical protein
MVKLSPDGPRLSVLIPATLGLATFFTFVFLGDRGRGAVAAFLVAAISYAAIWKWSLRRQPWFWGLILCLLAVHALPVFLIHWAVWHDAAIAFAPLAFADLAFCVAVISFFERRIAGDRKP